VLIAHFPTEMTFSFDPPTGGWCQFYWDSLRIEDCEDQVNRIDTGNQVIWFVLAAWDEEKEWCGTEFGFGEYNSDAFVITDFSPCWPENGLEIPTTSWPGPSEGTAIVTTGAPWEGNFVPVYRFTGLAYEEGLIPLAADPTTGFAGMSNCANPPESWAADSLGAMGLFQDGVYACPSGSIGNLGGFTTQSIQLAACCVGGYCLVATEEECEDLRGEYYPEYPSCSPSPCEEPERIDGDTLRVCPSGGSYTTIQAAIDAAQPGDIIELCCDATFTGSGNRDIIVPDMAITIRSACDDPERCIIDLEGQPEREHRGFDFATPDGTDERYLRGVTITHAYHC
jgi:hypothetical protein